MADSIVKLTREFIQEFARDTRTIRFFEQLQTYVVDAVPVSLAALFLRVDQVDAKADDALGLAQQAHARPDKQDTLMDVAVFPYLGERLLLDVPVAINSSNHPLLDVPVNINSVERQLNDVPFSFCCNDVLPEILAIPTDTRKNDEITSSYGVRWVGSSSGLTVNTTEVDLTVEFGLGTQTNISFHPFTYDAGANVLFASSEYTAAYFFDVVMRLSGTCPSPSSQSRAITFFLRRADASLITTIDYVVGRGLSGTFTNIALIIPTFVFAGGADPYQTQGFRISAAAADSGWSITDKTLFLKR